jgi:hypothetical protein
MRRWRAQMPKAMFLKSEGCASSLSDPSGLHTLARYCASEGLPYAERGEPVSRETFARYAVSFQQSLVPNIESARVVAIRKPRAMFELELSDGETLSAEKVIVATGMEHMAYVPPAIGCLPTDLRSHSADHYDLSGFKGKQVAVVGGGQSALETAALLHEEGASVQLLVREPTLAWNPVPERARATLYRRLRHPRTTLGDGIQLWLYANAPWSFRFLPQPIRIERVNAVLGPAGAWWLKERVVGRLSILLGHFVCGSEARGGRAILHLSDRDGQRKELTTDHVLAATGYRFRLRQLPFLGEDLISGLRHEQELPRLSGAFESSVPGLHFAGLASAYSFGPVMRFLAGAGYTARRISDHIAGRQRLGTMRSASLYAPPSANNSRAGG